MTLIMIPRHFGSHSQAMTGGPLKACVKQMNSCLMNLPRFQLDVNQSTGGLDGHHGLEIFITRRGSDSDQINKSKKSDRPLSFFQKPSRPFIEFLLQTTAFKLNPGVITSPLFYFYISNLQHCSLFVM